jgi:hypothetical protein
MDRHQGALDYFLMAKWMIFVPWGKWLKCALQPVRAWMAKRAWLKKNFDVIGCLQRRLPMDLSDLQFWMVMR